VNRITPKRLNGDRVGPLVAADSLHSPGLYDVRAATLRLMYSRLLAIFLITFAAFWPVHSSARQAPNADAQAHADAGLHLAQTGNLEQGEVELRRAVELDAHSEPFLADLGTILAMERKLEESSAIFERALKLDPRDITARRYLAANLWQLQRFPQAKQNLEILLKQKPGDQQALLLLGMVSENTKDYATAARALAFVPDLVRERPESIGALARSYYHIGEPEKARSVLEELQSSPAGAQGVFLGAQIADEMGDYGTAEKMLSSLESSFPDPAELGYTLAFVQYHAQQFQDARTTLVRLTESGYKSGKIYNLLGWCDHELHDPDNARNALEQAILLEPAKESNTLDLVKLLLAERRFSAALEAAKGATEEFPSSAQAFSLKGAAELDMEQYNDSIASCTKAVELDPASPDALLGLAAAQSAGSMTKEAAATLEKGRKQFRRDGRFPLEQGLLLTKDAEQDATVAARSEQLFRLALALDSSLPEAHYQLGNLSLKNGRLTEALNQLETAARLKPEDPKIHFALARVYRRLNRNPDAAREMDLFEKLKSKQSPAPALPSLGGTPRS
jgi:tetratricopeptide (TPR) repeat protein